MRILTVSRLLIAGLLAWLSSLPAIAVVVTDGTVGPALNISVVANRYNLPEALGTRMGSNLFHSFNTFSIESGRTANFAGSAGIDNVISRITGSDSSQIDGVLQSQVPGANFFLINPNGIVFGPSSRVNVPASLHVSTASYLKLGSDGRYDASSPSTSALTVSAPSAFGFGAVAPGDIRFEGRTSGPVSAPIEVGIDHQITVVGGNILITDRHLYAPNGKITLIAAGAPAEIPLAADPWAGQSAATDRLVSISNPTGRFPVADKEVANIDVSGPAGGTIVIRGGRIVMDSGLIEASSFESGSQGGIDIAARNSIELSGGASIATSSFGNGKGGSILLTSDLIEMGGGARLDANAAALFSPASSGDILLQAEKFRMRDESLLNTTTLSEGNAGNISIDALETDLFGSTRITSSAISIFTAVGNGGNIELSVERLFMGDDATINASSEGLASSTAHAGSIELHVGDMQLAQRAFIISDTATAGDAGFVLLQGNHLTLSDDIRISALTTGTGNAGIVELNFESVNFAGNALVSSETNAGGNAGAIAINAETLVMNGASAVAALTTSTGAGGDIALNIAGSMHLQNARISSESRGSGDAGSIRIVANHVVLDSGGTVSAVSFDLGRAGDIEIQALSQLEMHGAQITTETAFADGGNILVNAVDRIFMQGSQITTSVAGGEGAGGNIEIDPIFVILQRSDIIANAFGGPGGNIRIVADHLIQDPESRIEASSALGINGVVAIESPDANIISGIAVLPSGYLDVTQLARKSCDAAIAGGGSSLVMKHTLRPDLESLLSPLGSEDVMTEVSENPERAHTAGVSLSCAG